MDNDMGNDRKRSGNYVCVQGWIPPKLNRRFRAIAAMKELTIAEAMENAIVLWVESSGVKILEDKEDESMD